MHFFYRYVCAAPRIAIRDLCTNSGYIYIYLYFFFTFEFNDIINTARFLPLESLHRSRTFLRIIRTRRDDKTPKKHERNTATSVVHTQKQKKKPNEIFKRIGKTASQKMLIRWSSRVIPHDLSNDSVSRNFRPKFY